MKASALRTKPEAQCANENCRKPFRRFKSTDKYCSKQCYLISEPIDNKRNSSIRPVSKKRQQENREYLVKRLSFLSQPENHRCRVFPNRRATEIHHMMKRRGFADAQAKFDGIPLYLDERYWLPVSRDGHEWIENHPEESYRRGFSIRNNVKKE